MMYTGELTFQVEVLCGEMSGVKVRLAGTGWNDKGVFEMVMPVHPPEEIVIGVAYYPEHWPRERWPEDVRLMNEAGIRVVRLAELAWSFLEPKDGCFDFGWLDDFIDIAQEHRIRVILGTPGEASPVWLRHQNPQVVRMDESGSIRGGRGMHCHNNGIFSEMYIRRFSRCK